MLWYDKHMKLEIKKETNPRTGLSQKEVKNAKKNVVKDNTEKSIQTIIRQQTFTLFNAINVILAILVLMTGSYKNMLFMGVVVINAIIGIVQEIRSKRMLDRLALLNQPRARVLRDGNLSVISVDEIVENDILLLQTGDQITCDCIVVDGKAECNESMLTGESDPIFKQAGDALLSGSYLESGQIKAQVITVAEDTYANSILKNVKRKKQYPSQLRDSIQLIIRFSTIILIPAGILLFVKEFSQTGEWNSAILSMVAAVVGMIPEGLVFLTSVALAIGAIKLARKKVLVQELYCIETLARVDTLCLDKTGTITEGKMKVVGIEPLSGFSEEQIRYILAKMYGSLKDDNATAQAIRQFVDAKPNTLALETISFSSARKACGVIYPEDSYVMGAYPFVMEHLQEELLNKIEDYANKGMRVLVLAKANDSIHDELKGNHEPIALIMIQDVLREGIQKILSYFYNQGVDIKIISGDDSKTVAAIAESAGVKGSAMDMTGIENVSESVKTHAIFGRVTPEQKKEMVLALKKQGHTVAMTGDGVNDVMALKEADCSIAMASGSEATKNIATLVLLENQFSALPNILHEGRCVINNIQRTSSLFLVKTLFSFGLTLLTLFLSMGYPFVPIQLTLISALATGIPSFVLTLEPNGQRVTGHFLQTVFARALPGAFCVVSSVLILYFLKGFLGVDEAQFSTICTYLAGWNALCVLISVCTPMTHLRMVLVICMIAAFVFVIMVFPGTFNLVQLRWYQWIYCVLNAALIPLIIGFMKKEIDKYLKRI